MIACARTPANTHDCDAIATEPGLSQVGKSTKVPSRRPPMVTSPIVFGPIADGPHFLDPGPAQYLLGAAPVVRFSKAGGDHGHGLDARVRTGLHRRVHQLASDDDERQVDGLGHLLDGGVGRKPLDGSSAGVDGMDASREAPATQAR